jgi:cobalt-precorrin-5B (C1)-methyltransferase
VDVALPDGEHVELAVVYARKNADGTAEAAVRKDAGDDPDVTHKKKVVVTVSWSEGDDIEFAAGEGVGTVTLPGLQIPPGEPAINPVPRAMIRAAVREVTPRGVKIVVSIPGGAKLAEKTFNPRLGVIGGLSIIGTSGRVRPFSHPALQAALKCGIDVAVACEIAKPVFVPGHIGEAAARKHFTLRREQVVDVSNEWGYMLDLAAAAPFTHILVLGHPGKIAKLAAGEWDTHSSRSESAVGIVETVAAEVLGKQPAPSATVEGLFAALQQEEQRKVGDELAARVRTACAGRVARITFAVVLVNMASEIIGGSGDLSAWQ